MEQNTDSYHTVVVSDFHLSDAEPVHEKNPLWKRFKRKEHFIDDSFHTFISDILKETQGEKVELILNGDIFDFDSVTRIPNHPDFSVSFFEKLRGLWSEERKSRFKIREILRDHSGFVESLKDFLAKDHRIVFVVGNHDVELHWPGVQEEILNSVSPLSSLRGNIRFCEWFYVSGGDTLVEHGNQYDAYCVVSNPVHPLIRMGRKLYVRIPFADIAGRYMINGIGLMNPHVESSFIKSSMWDYLVFFYKYGMRIQPLMGWSWLWGAIATLFASLRHGFLPPVKDPLLVEARINEISGRANSRSEVARGLKEIHAFPAIFNPIQIARELWLDRAVLFLLLVGGSVQFFSFLKLFVNISVFWLILSVDRKSVV